jgi:hypothetical protein
MLADTLIPSLIANINSTTTKPSPRLQNSDVYLYQDGATSNGEELPGMILDHAFLRATAELVVQELEK